jgi:hypothetical protein
LFIKFSRLLEAKIGRKVATRAGKQVYNVQGLLSLADRVEGFWGVWPGPGYMRWKVLGLERL